MDGKNLSQLDPYWLRRSAIGIISQEPVLFATTIEENIRYGKTEATDEEVFDETHAVLSASSSGPTGS